MGVTENVGFNAKVQRNLGLDLVTKQHKSLQKLQPVYSLHTHTHLFNSPLSRTAEVSQYQIGKTRLDFTVQ